MRAGAARDQAGPRGPQQSAHPPCPMGQAQAGAVPNAGGTSSASQPLEKCWVLGLDLWIFLRTKGPCNSKKTIVEMWGNGGMGPTLVISNEGLFFLLALEGCRNLETGYPAGIGTPTSS